MWTSQGDTRTSVRPRHLFDGDGKALIMNYTLWHATSEPRQGPRNTGVHPVKSTAHITQQNSTQNLFNEIRPPPPPCESNTKIQKCDGNTLHKEEPPPP